MTLAHELTHVLQDQHFDLRKIEARAAEDEERRGGSSGAMLALIEGDANRVEETYLKGLGPVDRERVRPSAAARRAPTSERRLPMSLQLFSCSSPRPTNSGR